MSLEIKYKRVIIDSTLMAASTGVPGAILPLLDSAALSVIWINMLKEIAVISGHSYSSLQGVGKIVSSVLVGVSAYLAGCKIFTFLLNAIPGIGTFAAIGINAFLNALFTYRFGSVCGRILDRQSFDIADSTFFAEQILSSLLVLPNFSEIREIWGLINS